eukprot:3535326-Pleurochrysis_carterae.AAC.1
MLPLAAAAASAITSMFTTTTRAPRLLLLPHCSLALALLASLPSPPVVFEIFRSGDASNFTFQRHGTKRHASFRVRQDLLATRSAAGLAATRNVRHRRL